MNLTLIVAIILYNFSILFSCLALCHSHIISVFNHTQSHHIMCQTVKSYACRLSWYKQIIVDVQTLNFDNLLVPKMKGNIYYDHFQHFGVNNQSLY